MINTVLTHCATYRINPVLEYSKITYTFVRGCLHRSGYAHYFENISQIISRVTGRSARRFTASEKATLTQVFKEVQAPFERHKGKRRNFLSYSYTTYKSCELLGLVEFLPFLPLLKAPQNLLAADELWKKICADCGYQFVMTT